jgi:hypothetical protein
VSTTVCPLRVDDVEKVVAAAGRRIILTSTVGTSIWGSQARAGWLRVDRITVWII